MRTMFGRHQTKVKRRQRNTAKHYGREDWQRRKVERERAEQAARDERRQQGEA